MGTLRQRLEALDKMLKQRSRQPTFRVIWRRHNEEPGPGIVLHWPTKTELGTNEPKSKD